MLKPGLIKLPVSRPWQWWRGLIRVLVRHSWLKRGKRWVQAPIARKRGRRAKAKGARKSEQTKSNRRKQINVVYLAPQSIALLRLIGTDKSHPPPHHPQDNNPLLRHKNAFQSASALLHNAAA